MPSPVRLLLIRESHQIAGGLASVADRSDFDVTTVLSCRDGLARMRDLNPLIVIVDCAMSTPPGGPAAFERLLDVLHTQGIACLLLSDGSGPANTAVPDWVQNLDYSVSGAELFGRLSCIRHYQQIMRQAQLQNHHMQRLGRHLNKQFAEVDQDMRLASRLQQELLPRSLPEVEGVRFSVLYRPASWVSGDTYDITRVDEQHISLYVADAVGHGMAASLLTMLVRRAIHSKRLGSEGYRILSPSETLEQLNDSLADEQLTNCQYVTASYCMLNHKTMTLNLARGGHPYPILIEPDHTMREIKSDGGLLGLFPGQQFPAKQVQLIPGQKLILYSDGMELAFVEERDYDSGEPRYRRKFQELAHLPAEDLTSRLEQMIDAEEGSINPQDDVTVIVMDLLP